MSEIRIRDTPFFVATSGSGHQRYSTREASKPKLLEDGLIRSRVREGRTGSVLLADAVMKRKKLFGILRPKSRRFKDGTPRRRTSRSAGWYFCARRMRVSRVACDRCTNGRSSFRSYGGGSGEDFSCMSRWVNEGEVMKESSRRLCIE